MFVFCAVVTCIYTQAQTSTYDTVYTGEKGALSTFYSLATQSKTTPAYNDWHLAISVRASAFPTSPLCGTTMRMNEPIGVNVYYVPNTSAAQFDNMDTTGYAQWTKLHDSDTALDEGVLNSNRDRSAIFDFGWGVYNSATHNVVGDSVYLIQLPNGELKKFTVILLQRDTAFDIKYANIDNSNKQIIHIGKRDYIGKQFVYLNMLNNTVADKEPLGTAWDLQFLRYDASDFIDGKHVPVIGVWLNKGLEAARRTHHDVTDNNYSNLTFSTEMNTIGWNWKRQINVMAIESGKTESEGLSVYALEDSTSYFIKARNGDYYKLVFTGYNAQSGVISFYTQNLSNATAINEAENTATLQTRVFPNPAGSQLNVFTPALPATLRVLDLSGRVVNELPATDNLTQLNTSALANGVYLLQTSYNGITTTNRFIINQ